MRNPHDLGKKGIKQVKSLLLAVASLGLVCLAYGGPHEDDFLYNKMGTIKGTVVILNHPTLGRTLGNSVYLLFQRTDCKKCVLGVRTDLNGQYSVHVFQGRYRVILREGQIEGEGVDMLAPKQPRVVEVTSTIDPAKFDIEVQLPNQK